MDKLFIIIPAYNEAENIKQLIEEWYPVIERYGNEDSRMVIVNDGSKDATGSLLNESEKTRPLLKVLSKQNGGHGPAVIFGYKYALRNGADYIFQTDSDRQTDPDEFETFWNLRKDYDAVIGNRFDRKDGTGRIFVEKVLLLILRGVFGVKMPDSNAPFRLMNAGIVSKYLKKLPDDFNLPNVMLATYFVYFHEKVKFIDISFRPRRKGTGSLNPLKIFKTGIRALGDFNYLKKHINDND